jgi:hypothetical protein
MSPSVLEPQSWLVSYSGSSAWGDDTYATAKQVEGLLALTCLPADRIIVCPRRLSRSRTTIATQTVRTVRSTHIPWTARRKSWLMLKCGVGPRGQRQCGLHCVNRSNHCSGLFVRVCFSPCPARTRYHASNDQSCRQRRLREHGRSGLMQQNRRLL